MRSLCHSCSVWPKGRGAVICTRIRAWPFGRKLFLVCICDGLIKIPLHGMTMGETTKVYIYIHPMKWENTHGHLRARNIDHPPQIYRERGMLRANKGFRGATLLKQPDGIMFGRCGGVLQNGTSCMVVGLCAALSTAVGALDRQGLGQVSSCRACF